MAGIFGLIVVGAEFQQGFFFLNNFIANLSLMTNAVTPNTGKYNKIMVGN